MTTYQARENADGQGQDCQMKGQDGMQRQRERGGVKQMNDERDRRERDGITPDVRLTREMQVEAGKKFVN